VNWDTNPYRALAQEAAQGDPGAAGKLYDDLRPHLERMVRRAVRTGTARTPLERRILHEYERITGLRREPGSSRQIGLIAGRLCAALVDNLKKDAGRRFPEILGTVEDEAFGTPATTLVCAAG
jgi:hypothetical protein